MSEKRHVGSIGLMEFEGVQITNTGLNIDCWPVQSSAFKVYFFRTVLNILNERTGLYVYKSLFKLESSNLLNKPV